MWLLRPAHSARPKLQGRTATLQSTCNASGRETSVRAPCSTAKCQQALRAYAPPHVWCRRMCLSHTYALQNLAKLCVAATKPTGEHRQCASATLALNASGAVIARSLHGAFHLALRPKLPRRLHATRGPSKDTGHLSPAALRAKGKALRGLGSPGQGQGLARALKCDTLVALDEESSCGTKHSKSEKSQHCAGVECWIRTGLASPEDEQAHSACAAAVQRGDMLGQRRRSGARVPGTKGSSSCRAPGRSVAPRLLQ